MEETTQTNTTAAPAARPVFLTVLCILSFIAAGFGIIAYIGAIAVAGMASAALSSASAAASTELNNAMASYSGPSAGVIWAYIVVGFITTLASLFGVIKMWKLQKIGFFIYVGSAVVSMIMSFVYPGFSVMGVLFPYPIYRALRFKLKTPKIITV